MTSGGSDSIDTGHQIGPARSGKYKAERTNRSSSRGGTPTTDAHRCTSLSGITGNRQGYGALLADVTQVPWDSAEALAAQIDACGAEAGGGLLRRTGDRGGRVFRRPPVSGIGGEGLPGPGCLLIVDEVITGYGRIGGFWFASTRFGLQPDIVTGAKGVTSDMPRWER